MEVHYFTCDFCGRKIEEGTRIAATMQRIRRTPEYKFKFDMCVDCYEDLKRKATMGSSGGSGGSNGSNGSYNKG